MSEQASQFEEMNKAMQQSHATMAKLTTELDKVRHYCPARTISLHGTCTFAVQAHKVIKKQRSENESLERHLSTMREQKEKLEHLCRTLHAQLAATRGSEKEQGAAAVSS